METNTHLLLVCSILTSLLEAHIDIKLRSRGAQIAWCYHRNLKCAHLKPFFSQVAPTWREAQKVMAQCFCYVATNDQNDVELIGLHNPTNGRSWDQHKCCGKHSVVYVLSFEVYLH